LAIRKGLARLLSPKDDEIRAYVTDPNEPRNISVIFADNAVILCYQSLSLGATLCTIKLSAEIDIILTNPTSNLQKVIVSPDRKPQSAAPRT
jgi:hypothetical protein